MGDRCLGRAGPVEPGCPSGGGGCPLSGAAGSGWGRGGAGRGGGGVAIAEGRGGRRKLDPGGGREKGGRSGEAAAREAAPGRAGFLRSGAQVAKPGGHRRPRKPCQSSEGKMCSFWRFRKNA